MRVNYVTLLFRNANSSILSLEDSKNHDWDERGMVICSSICYPEDVTELLFTHSDEDETDIVENSD